MLLWYEKHYQSKCANWTFTDIYIYIVCMKNIAITSYTNYRLNSNLKNFFYMKNENFIVTSKIHWPKIYPSRYIRSSSWNKIFSYKTLKRLLNSYTSLLFLMTYRIKSRKYLSAFSFNWILGSLNKALVFSCLWVQGHCHSLSHICKHLAALKLNITFSKFLTIYH